MRADDRVLQFASVAFDAAVEEIFGALLTGAALVLRTEAWLEGARAFWGRCAEHRVTVADLPTRFWQLLLGEPSAAIPECVRLLAIGGEAVEPAALQAWFEIGGYRPPLLNTYGPTETTVNATLREIADAPATWRSIGRPVANTRTYLLDARGEPVPVRVAGELYIGGGQVARGYLDRPGLTAGRFVPDPFAREPGARLYRTGDLGRWLPDGSIEFLGRTDFQVKIRGFRIELGEIEARLAEHAAVRDAVVLAREDEPGDRRLVAYCVADEGVDVESLRAHLAERLPGYMVPAAFVRLDAFPVTAGGKVDRRALPAPEGDDLALRGYEAPASETEQALADIWAEVLKVERVGRRDSFFDLGGHSLLAVQVISRVRQRMTAAVALRDLFTRPVLADFARGLETASRAELPPIEPVERGADLPLSFAQQRLWFIDQMEGVGAAYHIPVRMRLRGGLDRAALRRALDRIVARHEALRTVFAEVDGAPVQRIAPADESPFHLTEHDLRGAAQAAEELGLLMADEARAPFDLARGPLIRGRLVQTGDADYVLLITMHHIVSDGWSMGVLTRELGALYAAFRAGRPDPLPPLAVQYADYAAWQRRWVEGEVLREQAEYWKATLSGAPELLELPTDRPRPARQDFTGGSVGLVLDEAVSAALRELSRRHGTTLYMTFLAGWAAVLARLSGQGEVVVGTPTANRGREEIEGLIGFFVNMLPVRVELSDAPTVATLLARVKERAIGAQHHQDIPFEQVVELVRPARSLSHTPLFQAMFAWQNAPGGGAGLPGLTPAPTGPAEPSDRPGAGPVAPPPPAQTTAITDLSLTLFERGGRIGGSVTYAAALFERETVERYVGYLGRVLEEMAAGDAKPVDRMGLLSPAERRRVVVEFNDGRAEYPRETFAHELFETQVKRTPGAAALVFDGETLSYAELNARVNRLAHHLRALGVGPDARVAICVGGPAMVVGALAVLKAGGAYLPLDPEYPGERLRYMLEDGAPAALLTGPALLGLFEGVRVPVLDLEAPHPVWADEPESDPERGALSPAHLAYVFYTSGSTGRPKGVRVSHGSLAATLAVARDAFGFGAGDRVPSLASFAFDIWLFETILPLLSGGTARLVSRDRVPDVPRLVDDLSACTHLHAVPALMRHIVEEVRGRSGSVLPTLRHAFVGGDAVAPDLLEEMRITFPAAEIHVLYGPTEGTIICASHRLGGESASRQMVGRPLGNATLYVVEPGGMVAPVGVPGELWLGGASVARDYLGRPRLTAERFVPDPFSATPGARLYRTGDRVRWLASGELEFLGRTDNQVKIRGFRIELGEIEARLAEHPALRAPVVLVREDAPGDRRLVAYYLADEPVAVDALNTHLAERLPGYMVPAAYVWMERLPLTPNGKVDRKALPAPEGNAYAAREYEAPVGETEQALAAIWAEVLRTGQVGRGDNFFELGGHSLLAVRVISRVRQALGVEAAIADLFVRPVLADFASGLETAARAELPAIEPVERGVDLPLSFAQQRLWFIDQLEGAGAAYHIPIRQRLRGELESGALRRALDRIVARHEALRTTFAEVDGEAVQRIARAEESPFHLIEHDLRGDPGAGAELRRLVVEEAGAPFDLAGGPLIRGRLVRVADDDHLLLITMHHIVSDGWSMGVFTRELGELYAAFQAGQPDPLPPLPIQYADYAVWQRKWVDGEVLQAQAEYWTETLGGAPELLELPTDHVRPARQDFSGGIVGIELDAELTAGVKALSQRHGATLFMTLLAGWAAVLSRLSGQDDVVIGTPTANRGRSEIEGLIGFFVNTLALRVELSGSSSISDVLARVKARALEAQANQDIPFEQVVELLQPVRSLSHTPLFQVVFSWQNAGGSGVELPGLAPAPLGPGPRAGSGAEPEVTAKFDLSLALTEHGGRIAGAVEYAASLFERATIERWLGYLHRALEAMVADESQSVARLPLLPEAERRLVVEDWNATTRPYPTGLRVHDLFRAQAARTPHAVALSWHGERLTYAELERRANQIANALRRRGVGPEVRVGICLPRTPDLAAAMLGVLGAGGAYVPLDPAYPRERLGYMLEDARVTLVITDSSLADRLPHDAAALLLLDAERDAIAAEPADAPESGVVPENLSHVIFTSGSTGRPKGVMIRHSSVVVLLHWLRENVTDEERSSVLFSTSINFDVSIAEVFGTLAWGGKLVLVENALELAELKEEVVYASMVPSAAAELLRSGGIPASVKTLNLGGEALPNALAQGLYGLETVEKVGNLYGPTEDTTYSTCYVVPRGADQVLVGTPVANTQAYILDRHLQPVPVGVVGELYLAGDGLSRGYANHPAMTAERFVPCPFGAPGARMYRVMDRVRRRADGEIEYLGRTDFQVKVRGYRIELGEIEARLAEHPGVRAPAVLVREDAPGDRRLVAYYLGDEPVAVDALKAHLADRLPEYMVPAAYVWMEAYPLTPNGKVDRKALPAPEDQAYAAGEYAAPVGDTEQALAEIWAEVLGVERVGRDDNFFELGGHSLLAVRMIARVRQVLEAEVSLAHLFSHPTVESLAARVSGAAPQVRTDQAIPIRPSGSQPPLFLVYEGAGTIAYAQVLHPHVSGDIPVYALPAPSADAPLQTVEGMATRLVRMIREVRPSGPYRVAGWSLGGVLAYEIASQLIGQDEIVEFVGMIDSYHPARFRAASHDAAREHALLLHVLQMAEDVESSVRVEPDEASVAAGDANLETFVTRCLEQGLLPSHVTVEQARQMRDRMRDHQRALGEYSPQPLPVAVHLFPAQQSTDPDPSHGWQATLPATRLQVVPVPGTHLSMMQAPNAATLGEALSRAIDRARDGAAPLSVGGRLPTAGPSASV
ncbi:MAG TPA: amino acid adenylation domain-containing protein [Longimicrobium sp.]|nr:amino acid adenylation domain-containing protein [Longimicrobium sp.]